MSAEPTVGYLTEPLSEYNQGITDAGSVDELRAFLKGWPTLAPDAIATADEMNESEWPEWRRGLAMEQKRKFAGEDWASRFMVILMPARMLRATVVSENFKVPWGLAWMRLKESGALDGGSR